VQTDNGKAKAIMITVFGELKCLVFFWARGMDGMMPIEPAQADPKMVIKSERKQ
jgi:hypothetical protein